MKKRVSGTWRVGNLLWGIYHTDREYAHTRGGPLRTVVEAPTRHAAEKLAADLGFGYAWARPVTEEEAQRAQWRRVRSTERSSEGAQGRKRSTRH